MKYSVVFTTRGGHNVSMCPHNTVESSQSGVFLDDEKKQETLTQCVRYFVREVHDHRAQCFRTGMVECVTIMLD